MRRGDAGLYFPDRVVQMHRVEPTAGELALIAAIAKPIQKLNRLAQISVLQALTSSPHALMAQLTNMARNGTVPQELALTVRALVTSMPRSAKLTGLAGLIDKLKTENPSRWRLVVFTGRRETQTTIETYLQSEGLKVGVINGDSGERNQETIRRFRRNPPDIHVIVSTEAGSEGVNLQAANVLVNYDLPWNPMIVEQRIGRIQRLASEHASVAIFNVMLKGTFEEYIVGRLMEKLQMAAHAIGDIEALLEASGMDDDDEEGAGSFDEQIRQLVLAALAGRDVAAATRKAEESIESAKKTLETEATTIDDTLGRMEGAEYVGPRTPTLPQGSRSMQAKEFALGALTSLGVKLTPDGSAYLADDGGKRLRITFDEAHSDLRTTSCIPGSAMFARTVDRVLASAMHKIDDRDGDVLKQSQSVARQWLASFDALEKGIDIVEGRRRFAGAAMLRVRATVAHDSYERLVEVRCEPDRHSSQSFRAAVSPLPAAIQDPKSAGIDVDALAESASADEGIQEFCRFYLERRDEETRAAAGDERKRKRLEDEFTPRLDVTLVAAEGEVFREVDVVTRFRLDSDDVYESRLKVVPSTERLVDSPQLGTCTLTGRRAPQACLGRCAISGSSILLHHLFRSAVSGRRARQEYAVQCSVSEKTVLADEVATSDVTGRLVSLGLLSTSAISGKRAEAEHVAHCQFTDVMTLRSELVKSEISAKFFRGDEEGCSEISGKRGHKSEFMRCHVTGKVLAPSEGEKCAVTGHVVVPGTLQVCELTGKPVLPAQLDSCAVTGRRVLATALERCAVTGKRVIPSLLESCGATGNRALSTELRECNVTHKRVMPSELQECSVTGKSALKSLVVTSSVSGAAVLREAATRSATGKYCLPSEVKSCAWSGKQVHPDDLRVCGLTGLPIWFGYSAGGGSSRLQVLSELLDGLRRNSDQSDIWDLVTQKASAALGRGRCKVEAAILSPDSRSLAVSVEIKTFLGLKLHHGGLVYSIPDKAVVGRSIQGKRGQQGWVAVS